MVASLVGCDSPDDPPVPPNDAGASCDSIEPFATGGEGDSDPLAPAPGKARAGRIEAGELPEDRTGLATWAAGDFVLANERVAVIVEDVGASDLYDPHGGRIVGLAARGPDGALIAADFNEILFGLGGFLVETEAVTVLADGSDGGPAIVRATGPLGAIDFAGNLISGFVPGDYRGWPAAIDYELAPGSDRVTITLHANESSARRARVRMLLQAFFQTSRMPAWTPLAGFDGWSGETPFLAFEDRTGGAAYAWEPPAGRALSSVTEQSGVLITQGGSLQVEACERIEVSIGSIVIAPTFDRVQALARSALGETSRTIRGVVREADGSPATDVRVHVTGEGDAHLTRGRVDENGAFELEVPDADVQVWAYRRGTPIAGPVAAPRGGGDLMLEMAPMGTIEVSVRDAASGGALPARVQLFPAGAELARPPASWGEPNVASGRADVLFAGAGGVVSARVPAGAWDVIVSRGYEYELVEARVDVSAGETEMIGADLVRSVETDGVLCADYHIHTTRSADADDEAAVKVGSLVADGLEIAVRSDHEFVADFDPVVRELGLETFALGLSGEELTTFSWGHFGVFPVQPDPTRPNAGAPRWPGRLPADVLGEARAMPGAPALIINHPRSGAAPGGYFNAVGYDPDTGTVSRMELWDEEFSVVEVLNDSSFEQNRDGVVADWLSMLRFGRRVFAVGSSDSHHIHSAPVGYPRTCLALGTDDPRAVTPEQVRDATSAGRSVISGGVYLEIEGPNGVGPGGEASGVGARAMLRVVVRAATWVDVDTLEVIVDGVSHETIDLVLDGAPERTDTLVFDQMIEVPVDAAGSFVIVVAAGDEELEPVHFGRMPFAMSNPIFLER